MGLFSMATRNILRKINRTLLVSMALCFAIASIISVYSGIEASSAETKEMIDEYQSYIVDMSELSDVQESMIQVSVGWGGGMGHGGGWGGMGGGSSDAVKLTQEEIDIVSSVELVEAVIPKISNSVGEVDMEQIRAQMRAMREQGGGGAWGAGGGGHGGGGGGGFDRNAMMASFYDYYVEGVPLDSSLNEKYSILPSNIVEGRQLNENDSGVVLIRDELKSFFSAGLGSTIDIEGHDFRIVGIYNSFVNRNTVYMSLPDAQLVAGMDANEYSSLDVYVEDKSLIDLVVYDMEEQLTDSFRVTSYAERNARFSDRVQQAQEAEIESLQDANDEVENSGNAIIIISLITAALIVLFLMMYTVKERTKEIGIFKALGFTENRIMSQFVLEGGIVGLIGGIFGIAIGWAGAPFIAEFFLPPTDVYSTIDPSIFLIAAGLGLSIFLGVVGSIYPAWKASRKSPAEAIRG